MYLSFTFILLVVSVVCVEMNKSDLISYLAAYGHEHLANFWTELSETEKELLINELKQLNFSELNETFAQSTGGQKANKQLSDDMEPVSNQLKGVYALESFEQLKAYEQEGLRAIGNNEVAVILLAGGQGTRLGVDYPKGMYSVGLPSKKSLFQLQAERLLKLRSLASNLTSSTASPSLPWYIMASEHTLQSTQNFFEQNDYFGLEKKDVMFFEQGTMPCFFKDGRLIMNSKSSVSRAPDGNGGLYRALRDKGVLDDMLGRGIKFVHVYCVDNILVKVADPVFTGFCISKHLNCGSKVTTYNYF